ncbi:transcriptional regulator [Sphingomonas montanisoli]|uniref:Transcriptional regulator n=1 Tax=Sphingomonas montanisoli TaxID=2606412 RepID=A0A5D9C3N1_9SPHN|nr:transcriptional regulator [Sphingomonas montanisoli]TZG25892.1 transcriptional regulator [Sphingomonas montanisoli]
MSKLELKPLLDEVGAAPMVGTEPKTLANWRVLGKGPKFIRVGRKAMYHPDDLIDWLAARRVSSTSERVAA